MKVGADGCFELRLLDLRGGRTQLDEAKSGQPQDASPSAVGEFRGGRRNRRGTGPGARRGRSDRRRCWGRSCLLGRGRRSRRGSDLLARWRRRGTRRRALWRRRSRRRARRGRRSRRRALREWVHRRRRRRARRRRGSRRRALREWGHRRRRRRARLGGSRRSRGRRGRGICGMRTGRACSRGAWLAGLQTVPQEFVALAHGLLGCWAIGRRTCGRPHQYRCSIGRAPLIGAY
jgi:hypothetical protein